MTDPAFDPTFSPERAAAGEPIEATQPAAAERAVIVNNKFQRAWVRLSELPGTMMVGPQGLFGPIPASTSTWITTSERERDHCAARGKPMLEVWIATPQPPSQAPDGVEAVQQGQSEIAESIGVIRGVLQFIRQKSEGIAGLQFDPVLAERRVNARLDKIQAATQAQPAEQAKGVA